MKKRTDSERRAYIRNRAFELAYTGNFKHWFFIEHHLRFKEDYPEAKQELNKQWLRRELDRICEDQQVSS